MDTPIMVSPQEIFTVTLAVCGAIVTVSAAMAVIGRAITKMKEPENKQDERITALEEAVKIINERLQLGNRRFEADTKQVEALEASFRCSNKIVLEGLQVLIEHDIDGNNTDRLKEMKHRLERQKIVLGTVVDNIRYGVQSLNLIH